MQMKITKDFRIRSWSHFITTDSLKVTLSISCRAEQVPGFISWAEWQIQYNASLRSEHFTLGPSMWPWFRWMSTSHLYSSNQQSLTETHAHTQSHWLSHSHSFSLLGSLSQQCSLRSWDEWEKKSRHRETPDTGEIYSHTRLFTPRQQSESQWSWQQLRGARLPCNLSTLPWRSLVTGPQTPDLQAPSPLLVQCRPGTECTCKGLQRSRMEAVTREASSCFKVLLGFRLYTQKPKHTTANKSAVITC